MSTLDKARGAMRPKITSLHASRIMAATASLLVASSSLNADQRPFLATAAKRNHVLFVNVGGALSDEEFAEAAEHAFSKVQINIWTNSIPAIIVRDLIEDPSTLTNQFGSKCCVAVFVERNAKGYSFLTAQGNWAMINLRGVESGTSNAVTVRDRRAKMLLKGLAYACGAGATMEPDCSLYYRSFTLAGMDATKVQISPMAYFPMLENLRAIGGMGILTPARNTEEDE